MTQLLESTPPSLPLLRPKPPRRRTDLLGGLLATTVALLPFLNPAGPGNTAPADVTMIAAIVVATLWVTRDSIPVRFPYAAGVMLLIAGGALAGLLSGAPVGVALVMVQDTLLLTWGACLALGAQRPSIIRSVARAWCRTAPLYAALGLAAYAVGFSPISGVTARDGVRAAYTFGDPNLAGNYLVTSLFIMAACKRPRSIWVRWPAYAVVVVAIGPTGSNGAFLTLGVGIMACIVISIIHHRSLAGLLALTTTVLVVAIAGIYVAPSINVTALRAEAAGSIPLLRDSVGRSGGSASERGDIVREGMRVFFNGDATGVGPARTKATLQADQAPYVKEAHNDYLATLLERGPLGVIGLLVLTLSVAVRSLRLVGRPGRRDELAAEVPRPWLLVSVCLVMASAAGFYEVLHFRHLWTFLGVLAALSLSAEVGAGAPLPLDGPAERTAQKTVQRTQKGARRNARKSAKRGGAGGPADAPGTRHS